MTFSLFSVVLILCIGAAVFVEVVRGMKRGFARAALGLAVVLLSVIGALAVTKTMSSLLSNPLSRLLLRILNQELPVLTEYRQMLPNLDAIITTLVDMILGPLLFLLLFMLLRLLLRILLSAVTAGQAKPSDADPRREAKYHALGSEPEPAYEGEGNSWFRRNDRAVGGVVGGVAGFFVAICLLSPLTGFLGAADTVYDAANDMGVDWRKIRVDETKLDRALSPFLDDVMVYLINRTGGQLLFDTASTATLNGHTVTLQDELEACVVVVSDTNRVLKILLKDGSSTELQKQSLQTLGNHIDESYVMCVAAADFIKGASGQWLAYNTFLTVKRPLCGEFVDPLMDEVLVFLYAYADPEYVGDDLGTMLGIYFIALDNGLLQNPDMHTLMQILDDGTVLNQIYAELEHNARMSGLVQHLTDATMEMMARSIDAVNLPLEQYDALMGSLAEAVTLVNGMDDTEFAEQVNTMTSYAVHYADQYGVSLPTSVAQMGVTAMMEQFSDKEQVTAGEMKAYMSHYLTLGEETDTPAPAPQS